jgi:hypothetical protein
MAVVVDVVSVAAGVVVLVSVLTGGASSVGVGVGVATTGAGAGSVGCVDCDKAGVEESAKAAIAVALARA